RPPGKGWILGRGGGAEADRRDPAEAATTDDRIGRMGRAEHDPRDAVALVADLAEHVNDDLADAAGHIFGRGLLRPGDDLVLRVEDDGVGVGSADIDSER